MNSIDDPYYDCTNVQIIQFVIVFVIK